MQCAEIAYIIDRQKEFFRSLATNQMFVSRMEEAEHETVHSRTGNTCSCMRTNPTSSQPESNKIELINALYAQACFSRNFLILSQAISFCVIMSQSFSFRFSKYKKVYSLIERMETCY